MAWWKVIWKLLFPTPRIFYDSLTCWILLAINFGIAGRLIKPFSSEFSDSDFSLSKIYKGRETISDLWLVVTILLLPLGLFALSQIYWRSLTDLRMAFLAVCEAITVASTFARWMKLCGRLRPDFLARYETGDVQLIADGRMSFPSEHTTYSFASLVVVFWYIIGKAHIWETSRPSSFLLSIMSLCPLMLATFAGLSRTMDNVHHFSDVIAGAMLGSLSGTYAYFQNFPHPFHADCHVPNILLEQDCGRSQE